MLTKIDGLIYIDLIESGIKNLENYMDKVNDLNVFPVPDGDTGTNMVMTLKYGYEAIKNKVLSLSEIAQLFSEAAVFGARGNSGVITSQFFKGVTEVLKLEQDIDARNLVNALITGYKYAYESVNNPVEGTMLTVLKDAVENIKENDFNSIDEVIDSYLKEARISLQNTPELLPILKKAGVVDSGASGIVYFFEGIQKYLNGETIATVDNDSKINYIDLNKFNKDTKFDYGYCIEGLIQLKIDTCNFDKNKFNDDLSKLGESIVTTLENDKVKLHIHVKQLDKIMAYCQQYGEFLTIKIENMTVQNINLDNNGTVKFLYSNEDSASDFAIVAVATNKVIQQRLFDMGADIVILSEIAPSSQDFIEAFKLINKKNILVFPNSSNSIMVANKSAEICNDLNVLVVNSRTLCECYIALSIIDFENTIDKALSVSEKTISNAFKIGIFQSKSDRVFGSEEILKDDFFALSNDKIFSINKTLDRTVIDTIMKICEQDEYNVVTLFCGLSMDDNYIEYLKEEIMKLDLYIEVAVIQTYETMYSLIMIFE